MLVVARDPDKLARVRSEIETAGGQVAAYPCDITDEKACQQLLARVLSEQPSIDILINNAGRSIRRAIENTYDRFHDYERLMRLNYFAAVRITLGVLPSMLANGGGHVITISSIGVLSNAARFAGYNASKAAIEAFSRCAAAEYRSRGMHFTVINMPLVRTPMVAPTRAYDSFPLMQPEQAADIVCEAIVRRPERLATRLGVIAQLLEALAPSVGTAIMSESFRMFPESAAAGGSRGADSPSADMVRFASLIRGIHW
jgi:short-subunit dehydrogenase